MPILIATNTMPNGDTVHTVAKQFMRSGVSQDVEENTDGSSISAKALQREGEGLEAFFDDKMLVHCPVPLPEERVEKRPEKMKALKKKVKVANIAYQSKERLLGLLSQEEEPPTYCGQYDSVYHVEQQLKHLLEKTKERVREIKRGLKRPREEDSDEGEAGDKTAAPMPKRIRRSLSESKSNSPQPLRRTASVPLSVPTSSMRNLPEPAKVVETSA